MALTPTELAAVAKLNAINGGNYDPSSNPDGIGNDGHRTNFVPGLHGVGLLGQAVAREAAAAAASAAAAAGQSAALFGTSTTSVAISAGIKTLTTQAGKAFSPGTFLLLTSDANPTTHYMGGQVTAYSGTSLTVSVTTAVGSDSRADWTIRVAGAVGPGGGDGREVQIRSSGTHIQWRYVGDVSWTDIIAVADLDGADGREVELQASATHIQWRYVGAGSWTNLVALADLAGSDGREVELQRGLTHIQWRHAGGSGWADLVALADIDGDDGREVELRKSTTHIQWRYVGAPGWSNIVALADLVGGTGPAPTLTIGTVTSGPYADADITGNDGAYELDLVLPASTAPGPAGSQILNGARDPVPGDGNNDDYWLQSADGAIGDLGDFWTKSGGAWTKLFSTRGPAGEGSGDVTGPGGGVADGEFALFNGTTGKAIKTSGTTLAALNASIAAKFTLPAGGGAGHYLNGLGALVAFPAIPAAQVPSDWNAVSGLAQILNKPLTYPPSAHAHAIGDVTNLSTQLAAKAPLASPALTGTPTVPTATAGTASTQAASTKFVADAIAALIASAPGALDTLDELAAAMGDDPNFAATITAALGGKLAKSSNLSDLTDVAAARTALQLGSAALSAAAAFATAAQGAKADSAVQPAALNAYALVSALSAVATSGNYADLSNRPTIPAAVAIAAAATVRAGTDTTSAMGVKAAWDAHAPTALTDAATITPNFGDGINFTVTLGGNRTIANPTNQSAGRSGLIIIKQDVTGSRTASWGANWIFQGGAPTLSTAAGAVDVVSYFVEASGTVRATFAKGG